MNSFGVQNEMFRAGVKEVFALMDAIKDPQEMAHTRSISIGAKDGKLKAKLEVFTRSLHDYFVQNPKDPLTLEVFTGTFVTNFTLQGTDIEEWRRQVLMLLEIVEGADKIGSDNNRERMMESAYTAIIDIQAHLQHVDEVRAADNDPKFLPEEIEKIDALKAAYSAVNKQFEGHATMHVGKQLEKADCQPFYPGSPRYDPGYYTPVSPSYSPTSPSYAPTYS